MNSACDCARLAKELKGSHIVPKQCCCKSNFELSYHNNQKHQIPLKWDKKFSTYLTCS